MKVGLIGVGVVGGAIAKAIEEVMPLTKFDINGKYEKSIEAIKDTNVCFVCVPTPTVDDKQDLSAVMAVFDQLNTMEYKGIIVLKSTVVPGTCDGLQRFYSKLVLAHNPEFLTEKNAYTDYKNQPTVIFSTREEFHHNTLKALHAQIVPNAKYVSSTDFKVTEMCKYIHNCFLATKIAFMNEIYNLCEVQAINYDEALACAKTQGKLGDSHLAVPGPDGKFGFGGMCFPKDTSALAKHAIDVGAPMYVLEAVIDSNATQRNRETVK